MRNTILSISLGIVLAFCSAWNSFATGAEGVNPQQNGIVTGNTTSQTITNSFPFPYTVPPVMQFFPTLTNATPLTNVFVTTTNFAISFPAAGTNTPIGWMASIGATRMEYGTNAFLVAVGSTNITFPFPYSQQPSVVCSGSTNAYVTATTLTNFTLQAFTNETIYWQSIGTTLNPGGTLYSGPGSAAAVNPVTY
jgi:hypothetical protein